MLIEAWILITLLPIQINGLNVNTIDGVYYYSTKEECMQVVKDRASKNVGAAEHIISFCAETMVNESEK